MATVTPTLDGDVLQVLATHDVSFTAGQVRRVLNNFSEEGIRKVLARLQAQGVVLVERVGNVSAYRLNSAHLAAPPIIALAGLFSTFLKKLEETLETWEPQPKYAAVFGSAVRGTMSTDSDIDLLLVGQRMSPEWESLVHQLAARVTSWTGNDARIVEYSVEELGSARSEPVLQDVLAHGLTVAGSRSWLLKQLQPAAARTK